MGIEHCVCLSSVRENMKARNTKTMRKIAGRSHYDVSARRSCHGLHVVNGFHPSDGAGHLAFFGPRDGRLARHRPAAGLLLDVTPDLASARSVR
ncbi:hypothetical protein ACSVBT_00420 [Afipia sp. TerB]